MAYIFKAKETLLVVDQESLSDEDVEQIKMMLDCICYSTRDDDLKALVYTAQGLLGTFLYEERKNLAQLRSAVHHVLRYICMSFFRVNRSQVDQ